MGRGSYTASDWAKLKASRNLTTASANQSGSAGSVSQIFTAKSIQDKYNARYVDMRESFDSEDSPESTPIILGFDVTGSMGYLAREIAARSLNETIMQILAGKPVSDPHMMCAAFTDPGEELQVTQFEADIRVVEQLLDFKLGGGNAWAADNLLWYFAAKHTKTDCYDKRRKKGILIGIGDERCGQAQNTLGGARLQDIFGEKNAVSVSFDKALKMAQERYDVVHIVVGEEMRFEAGNRWEAYSGWKKALPGRVAGLRARNIDCLAEVIVAVIRILRGATREEALAATVPEKQKIVAEAIADFSEDRLAGNPFRDLFRNWL